LIEYLWQIRQSGCPKIGSVTPSHTGMPPICRPSLFRCKHYVYHVHWTS